MKRITIVLLAVIAVTISAKEFPLTVQKGGAEIIKDGTGEQKLVSESAIVFPNDMISLMEGQQVAVTVENTCILLVKGPTNVTLIENGTNLVIALEAGQVLIDRKEPYEYTGLSITSKGYSFVPIGCCCAVKSTPDGNPSAAVIDGKVRMQSPSGKSLIVEKGNYGSVRPDGTLSTQPLSPRALQSLDTWRSKGSMHMAGNLPPEERLPEDKARPSEKKPHPPLQTTAAAPVPPPHSAKKKTADTQPSTSAPVATAAAPSPDNSTQVTKAEKDSDTKETDIEQSPESPDVQKVEKTPAPPSSAKWQISAGTATINDEQWTRLAVGVDVPIWKFGVFFDVEFFIDSDGKFSDKGWNFEDDWLEALSRKIRYIRFGQEGDPLFVKLGGLSSVTLGYGFLVDRFTNMLHYPDEKLLGLQFDINDISPIGVSLQTLVADFKDFDNDGGLIAARLGFKPFKSTDIPIVSGITISGSYARDLNQYAPARKWDYPMEGDITDRDEDHIVDSSFYYSYFGDKNYYNSMRDDAIEQNQFDTVIEHKDHWAMKEEDPFGLIGGDISVPLIATNLVGLDLYGQAGIRDDDVAGWGIGVPGLSLKVWRFWGSVEYRRIQGRFQPGYFGTYYLDERLHREPVISTKEDRLQNDTLNGVFGRMGFNISDIFLIEGRYQYMVGRDENSKDQRFEACGALGDLVLQKIPKLNKAEIYYYKSRIRSEHDKFFEKTPFMYYGYRAGFAISDGASLIWDARYGFKFDELGNLVANNNISVQTALTF